MLPTERDDTLIESRPATRDTVAVPADTVPAPMPTTKLDVTPMILVERAWPGASGFGAVAELPPETPAASGTKPAMEAPAASSTPFTRTEPDFDKWAAEQQQRVEASPGLSVARSQAARAQLRDATDVQTTTARGIEWRRVMIAIGVVVGLLVAWRLLYVAMERDYAR